MGTDAQPNGVLRHVSSYVRSARSRLSARTHRMGGSSGDTLLPTTFSSLSSSSSAAAAAAATSSVSRTVGTNARHTSYSRLHAPRPASVACNSFLMGGQFYPGKDKKRRHMRRRTWWYRVFLSSPVRKTFTFLLAVYFLVYHVFLPTVHVTLRIGNSLSQNRPVTGDWLHQETDLYLPDIRDEQTAVIEQAAYRATLLSPHPSNTDGVSEILRQRSRILQSIVPQWYSRNQLTNQRKEDQQGKQPPSFLPPTNTDTPDIRTDSASHTHHNPDASLVAAAAPAAIRIYGNTTRTVLVRADTLRHRSLSRNNLQSIEQRAACTAGADSTHETNAHVTLVLQTTLDRLWILEETCRRWTSPIVVSVFIPHETNIQAKHEIVRMSSDTICPQARFVHYQASPDESSAKHYPINRLRNVALDHVTTSHVLVADVDLVPSSQLDVAIAKSLPMMTAPNRDSSNRNTALIVPAFERYPPQPCETDAECRAYLQSNSTFLPRTFRELKQCVADKACGVFQGKINWEGHSSTRSTRWLSGDWYETAEDGAEQLKTVACFESARYEPYVVVPWCASQTTEQSHQLTPYYDERFHGYGKNKIQLITHLRLLGYRFMILPEGFVVHNPHSESTVKQEWNSKQTSDLHSQMDRLYTTFQKELHEKYQQTGVTGIVPLCKKR